MAILFAGSSPEDIPQTIPNTATGFALDATLTPVGLKVVGDFENFGSSFTISHAQSASTVTWYHFLFQTNAVAGYSNTTGYWFRIWNGATLIAEMDQVNFNQTLKGGGQTSAPFGFWTPNVDITYDVKVTCDGVNVTVEVFQDGFSITSITYASAVGSPTSISWDHFDLLWNTTTKNFYYSEFIVTDNEPTTGWRLATLTPNLDGASTAWAGGVANVQTFGDGLAITAAASALKQGWTLSAYGGPATAAGVRAVMNKFIASKGISGPTQITPYIRHAATDVAGTTFSPDGTVQFEVLDNNPQTGIGWDTADLTTLEVGVESLT